VSACDDDVAGAGAVPENAGDTMTLHDDEVEALLRGDRAALDERHDVAGLAAFVAAVRAESDTAAPPPSPALATLLERGLMSAPRPAPVPARRPAPARQWVARLAAAGVAAQFALGAGLATAAVTAAAAAGVLPSPVQTGVARVVDDLTGIQIPGAPGVDRPPLSPPPLIRPADPGSEGVAPGATGEAPTGTADPESSGKVRGERFDGPPAPGGAADSAGNGARPGGPPAPRPDSSRPDGTPPEQPSPGRPTSSPGQSGTAPGQSGTAPGQSGTAPGRSDTAPGQSGTAPGTRGTAPGQTGTAPGDPGSAPGSSSAPGRAGSAPGNSPATDVGELLPPRPAGSSARGEQAPGYRAPASPGAVRPDANG
jgi:hypothetical protein